MNKKQRNDLFQKEKESEEPPYIDPSKFKKRGKSNMNFEPNKLFQRDEKIQSFLTNDKFKVFPVSVLRELSSKRRKEKEKEKEKEQEEDKICRPDSDDYKPIESKNNLTLTEKSSILALKLLDQKMFENTYENSNKNSSQTCLSLDIKHFTFNSTKRDTTSTGLNNTKNKNTVHKLNTLMDLNKNKIKEEAHVIENANHLAEISSDNHLKAKQDLNKSIEKLTHSNYQKSAVFDKVFLNYISNATDNRTRNYNNLVKKIDFLASDTFNTCFNNIIPSNERVIQSPVLKNIKSEKIMKSLQNEEKLKKDRKTEITSLDKKQIMNRAKSFYAKNKLEAGFSKKWLDSFLKKNE